LGSRYGYNLHEVRDAAATYLYAHAKPKGLETDCVKFWSGRIGEIDPNRLFLLPERQIDSYLMQPRALAEVFHEQESIVRTFVPSNGGKEQLESLVRKFGVKPSAEVKKIIARHVEPNPRDFLNMLFRVLDGFKNFLLRDYLDFVKLF
jgi:hypothetical protein